MIPGGSLKLQYYIEDIDGLAYAKLKLANVLNKLASWCPLTTYDICYSIAAFTPQAAAYTYIFP